MPNNPDETTTRKTPRLTLAQVAAEWRQMQRDADRAAHPDEDTHDEWCRCSRCVDTAVDSPSPMREFR